MTQPIHPLLKLRRKGNYCIKHDIVKFDCKTCKPFIEDMSEMIQEMEKWTEINRQIKQLKRKQERLRAKLKAKS